MRRGIEKEIQEIDKRLILYAYFVESIHMLSISCLTISTEIELSATKPQMVSIFHLQLVVPDWSLKLYRDGPIHLEPILTDTDFNRF